MVDRRPVRAGRKATFSKLRLLKSVTCLAEDLLLETGRPKASRPPPNADIMFGMGASLTPTLCRLGGSARSARLRCVSDRIRSPGRCGRTPT